MFYSKLGLESVTLQLKIETMACIIIESTIGQEYLRNVAG